MKITAIKQQVKRHDRYSVFIDGKYRLSLSEGELIRSGLRIGQELDEQQSTALLDTAERDKAYDRSLRFVSIRLRSEWEMQEYLKRKKYEPEVIEATLARLRENRWLDDAVFARAWVENRRLLKSVSKKRLQLELRQKHVSSDIIISVLSDDEADDRSVLKDLIAKKRRQTKYREDPVKLMQYLARQGFSYDDIKQSMKIDEVD